MSHDRLPTADTRYANATLTHAISDCGQDMQRNSGRRGPI
ncbi:hypothetical protein BRAS3843_2920003 [Bradyrhizobium sp. STM 3843]|nr:hypothetical protein BRAS3843_2920003 [Bradyrhizobium sp. STM 3843]